MPSDSGLVAFLALGLRPAALGRAGERLHIFLVGGQALSEALGRQLVTHRPSAHRGSGHQGPASIYPQRHAGSRGCPAHPGPGSEAEESRELQRQGLGTEREGARSPSPAAGTCPHIRASRHARVSEAGWGGSCREET